MNMIKEELVKTAIAEGYDSSEQLQALKDYADIIVELDRIGIIEGFELTDGINGNIIFRPGGRERWDNLMGILAELEEEEEE